jgi:dolichyl-phosphate beta-glucosyltransferase
VVVPAYDEEERLAASLPRVLDYLESSRLDAEVLVIDDGSHDATAAVARRLLRGRSGRVVALAENRGKGHAFRRGFAEAAGRWVLLTDADLSTPIEEHRRLADSARERDLDLVIGSRAHENSRIEVHQSRLRESMGKSFNLAVRILTGLPYRDTQCGFKLLDRRRLAPIVERMVVDRFAFDAELLFLAVRYGLRVGEVPIAWRNSERSTVTLVRDPLNMLLDLVRVRWRFRRGLYHPKDAPGGGA